MNEAANVTVKWENLSLLLKVGVMLAYGVGGFYLLSVLLGLLTIFLWS